MKPSSPFLSGVGVNYIEESRKFGQARIVESWQFSIVLKITSTSFQFEGAAIATMHRRYGSFAKLELARESKCRLDSLCYQNTCYLNRDDQKNGKYSFVVLLTGLSSSPRSENTPLNSQLISRSSHGSIVTAI